MNSLQNMETSLLEAVSQYASRYHLLPRTGQVVVAVSGGADSVALLDVLRKLAQSPDWDFSLTVAHLDHQIRPTSPEDARFVEQLAQKWNLPVISEKQNIPQLARQWQLGLEEAARKARYDFFARLANETKAHCVAVAHHAGDNVETILHHILRGTHLRGAAGMKPSRPLEGCSAMLVRPLLTCTRQDIEAWCHEHHLSWQTDITNIDTNYTRNFIRHELLPLVRQRINPQADQALLRFAQSLDGIETHLTEEGLKLLEDALLESAPTRIILQAAKLDAAGPIVSSYAWRLVLERLRLPMAGVTADMLTELTRLPNASNGATVNLPDGTIARKDACDIVVTLAENHEDLQNESIPLNIPGITKLADGREISVTTSQFDPKEFRQHCQAHHPWIQWLDADKIQGSLTCRTREPGDALHPLGSPGTQRVSDYLTNAKLPRHRRSQVRCICDQEGIVCLAPLQIADRVRITGDTERILRIQFPAQD